MMRWNREAAMLGIPDLPEEGFKHVGDRKIKPQGGSGGGGGGHTTSENVTYTSPVPEWLKDEQKEVVARGLALAQQPYQAYTGERISQFTPLQQRAFGAAERQQVAPQMGLATGLAGISGLSSFRDPGMAGSFMNPFLEQALAPQLAGVARESAIRGTQQQGEATQRGAFGGSRDAIMRAEREKNLMAEQSAILGRGYAQAFDTAQQQFNAERAAQLQAAGQLGQLGQTQFGQEMNITGLQRDLGAEQRQREQAILDQQFADFQAQKDFPYQQVGFASDIIQGRGGSSRSMFQQPGPTAIQNLAGLGTAAIGLKGLMAKGGEVQHYADGGITGLLSDQELAQTAQNPTHGPMMQMAALDRSFKNNELRAVAPEGLPGMQPETAGSAEVVLTQKMVEALNRGDKRLAEELAEALEEIKVQQEVGGIAGMMPEQMAEGIPEGGIMAMAMGGEVQGFSEGGSSQFMRDLRSFNERIHTPPNWEWTQRLKERQQRIAEEDARKREEEEATRERRAAITEAQGKASFSNYLFGTPEREAEGLAELRRLRDPSEPTVAPAIPAMPATPAGIEAVAAQNTTDAMRNRSRKATREAAQERAAEQRKVEEAAAKGGPKPDQSGIMGSVGASVLPRTGFDTQAAMANEFGAQQGIAASLVQGADAAIAAQEEAAKARGLFGEARERRLKEEEEGLKGKRDEARSMALFQAGLSMLSADPSKGALAAIGSGAIQGLGAYKGDLKDLQSRQERIRDKMDEIEDIRRREADADGKEKRALIAERNKAIVEGQKLMATTMSRFTDINREDANIIADRVFRRELASMPSGEERILRALGGGDLAKGFEMSKRLGQKPADLMGEFNDYIKANPLLGTQPQEQQMAAFFRAKMTLGGINVPKPSDKPTGQVRQ